MSTYQYKNLSDSRQKGNVALPLTILFGLVLLTVVYLIQVNQLVTKNFEMRQMQSLLEEKQKTNQKNLISLIQARSLNNLEGVAKNLNLVTIDKMNYLKTISGFVALSQ
jgi:hypothetical protein